LGVIAGQMILSPVVSRVIEGNGWRTAWLVLGVVVFVCGLPAMALAGRKPPAGQMHSDEAGPDDHAGGAPAAGLTAGEAAKTFAFWILMLSGAAIGLGFYAFNAHIVSYATDVGLTAERAALIFTVSSVGGVLGSLLAGAITVKLGNRWSLLLLTGLTGVAILLFIPAASVRSFYLLGVLVGFAFSGAVPVRMAIIPPLFGTRAVGTLLGLASLSFSVGAIVGPYLAGYIFDSTGSYDLAFLIFGVFLAAGTFLLFFLRSPKPVAATAATPIWRAEDGLG
jgi:MFS family permease